MIDYLRIPVFTGNYFKWNSTGKWVGALEVEGFWVKKWLILGIWVCFLVFFVENGEFLLNSVGFLAFLRENI